MKKTASGFSLMEMLAVIAIISVLMGMLLSGGSQAKQRARIYKTKAMIASLDTAIALYHTDFGAYPGAGNQNLVDLLSDAATYSGNNDWHGPYMSFKAGDLNSSAEVIDAWGNKYNYTLGTLPTDPVYMIWSIGPDESNGTSDDLVNW